MSKLDLLRFSDLGADAVRELLARAAELKAMRARGEPHRPLAGKTLGMIFEKASTRTRVSFEVGMFELGGHAVYLTEQGSQIGRGEPVRDTARVLGRYCHAIVVRTFGQEIAEELARFAPVPVINGLTDRFHPCQVLADLFTAAEHLGGLGALGRARFAWIGDGNNMAHSWIEAAGLLGLELRLACPPGYEPDPAIVDEARASGGRVEIGHDPRAAALGADVVSTDVWASMGDEDEADKRRRAFAGFSVDEELLAAASPRAAVLHCLPAHRGEEISEAVLEGPRALVWTEAENRLHVQKAVLERLLAGAPR